MSIYVPSSSSSSSVDLSKYYTKAQTNLLLSGYIQSGGDIVANSGTFQVISSSTGDFKNINVGQTGTFHTISVSNSGSFGGLYVAGNQNTIGTGSFQNLYVSSSGYIAGNMTVANSGSFGGLYDIGNSNVLGSGSFGGLYVASSGYVGGNLTVANSGSFKGLYISSSGSVAGNFTVAQSGSFGGLYSSGNETILGSGSFGGLYVSSSGYIAGNLTTNNSGSFKGLYVSSSGYFGGGLAVANSGSFAGLYNSGNLTVSQSGSFSGLYVSASGYIAGGLTVANSGSFSGLNISSLTTSLNINSTGLCQLSTISTKNIRTNTDNYDSSSLVSTWTTRTTSTDKYWESVCWSPQLGIFCAVSDSGSGNNNVMTSPDGINWTTRTTSSDRTWYSVCWSPQLGLFCAVSYTSAEDNIMTSPDGINWTTRTTGYIKGWRAVCWSPELGIFCAVSRMLGGNDNAITSPDGINWTTRTTPTDKNWESICWSSQLGLFCAVSYTASGNNNVMTSPDGINWTTRTTTTDKAWCSVCWSSKLRLFCAVSYSSTNTNDVMTSPDGINWTTQSTPINKQWRSVAWSQQLGLFCAVASSASGANAVMTSPDGINWTSRSVTTERSWHSICWAPQLGIFCAVSVSANNNNNVMTSLSYPVIQNSGELTITSSVDSYPKDADSGSINTLGGAYISKSLCSGSLNVNSSGSFGGIYCTGTISGLNLQSSAGGSAITIPTKSGTLATLSDIAFFDMPAPMGFLNQTDTTISFNDSERKFTIAPVSSSFSYYWKGTKITKSASETATITDTEGIWFFYYNNTTLTYSQTPWSIIDDVPISYIYWDATNKKAITIAEERHMITMDAATHYYLHHTVGARYASGLTLTGTTTGTGNAETDFTIALTGGTICDEDININVTTPHSEGVKFSQDLSLPAFLPVFYRLGANGDWRVKTANKYPFLENIGTRISYNQPTIPNWVTATIDDNNYVASWICCTNDLNNPVIVILGQRQDTTLVNAQTNNTISSISFGSLPFAELKILYRLIFRSRNTFSNTAKAILTDIQDLRSTSSLPGGTYTSTDHGSLSGLTNTNSHPASAISVNTASFTNILSSSDSDIQTALNSLDQAYATTSYTGSFAGVVCSNSGSFGGLYVSSSGSFRGSLVVANSGSFGGLYDSGDLFCGGAIKLATSGGTASSLNYYEEHTHTTNWGGIWASDQAGNVSITRIGKIVVITVPLLYDTGTINNAVITISTAIPSRFRPAATVTGCCRTVDNDVDKFGSFAIQDDGLIKITNGASLTSYWGGSGGCGSKSFSCSYISA